MLQIKIQTTQKATKRAKELRQNQTFGEKILWRKLRAKRFHGIKFRRQVPLGPYIADFLCAEKNIVIEIDGDSHYEPGAKKHDENKDSYLCSHGFLVLRFGNRQTIENLKWVLMEIGKKVGVKYE
jgi:very-short-patch-repair endonuclease